MSHNFAIKSSNALCLYSFEPLRLTKIGGLNLEPTIQNKI